MLTLYGKVQTRTLRPLWLLEELGLPFAFVPTMPRSEDAFAVSPLGKVPVLVTEEGPLCDSVAIMTWLADRAGRFTHPAGSYLRGRQDALTHAINEMLDAPLWEYAKHSFVHPAPQRVRAVKDVVRWELPENAARLAPLIQGPFLMGADPLVPDILLAQCTSWADGIGIALPEALTAHRAAMESRPAHARAMAHAD